jgi:hypothetical protein
MADGDIDDPKDYGSLVRNNLMKRPGYSPYCGNGKCSRMMPRMDWNGSQFYCGCGYETNFPDDFISQYKERWHSTTAD